MKTQPTSTSTIAIARSIQNNEIVTIDYSTAAYRALDKKCDGATDGNHTTEFWGTDRDDDGGEWRVHVRHVTDEAIEALRDAAAKAGDEAMVDICERALNGSWRDRKRAIAAIDAAADMGDEL